MGVGLSLAARAVFGAVVNPLSTYETARGAASTVVSASFLYLIAVLNDVVLSGMLKVFREMRRGTYDEAELEAQLQSRGLMYRFFGRFMRSINHTWQLYFVGMVFRVGFDTAAEVVLVAATAYTAIQFLPYYAVLCSEARKGSLRTSRGSVFGGKWLIIRRPTGASRCSGVTRIAEAPHSGSASFPTWLLRFDQCGDYLSVASFDGLTPLRSASARARCDRMR